jgi:polar amino acid transport system permease protein
MGKEIKSARLRPRHLTNAELFGTTDMPVLNRPKVVVDRPTSEFGGRLRLRAWHGIALAVGLLLSAGIAEAASGPKGSSFWVISTLLKWTPLLAEGFLLNLIMSFLAMALGTLNGTILGLCQVSLIVPVRKTSWLVTQFFRNAPWLVLMFYVMFLFPFQIKVAGLVIQFPDWIKAVIGFSLPVMANVSELVRGAVQSIPSGQWEAARSLALTRRQMFMLIIIPQCVKRVLPPWMNLYAILTMATVLASVVGVQEMMTLTGEVLVAEQTRTLLLPIYFYVLCWFFAYCYPIAVVTQRLERRFAVLG